MLISLKTNQPGCLCCRRGHPPHSAIRGCQDRFSVVLTWSYPLSALGTRLVSPASSMLTADLSTTIIIDVALKFLWFFRSVVSFQLIVKDNSSFQSDLVRPSCPWTRARFVQFRTRAFSGLLIFPQSTLPNLCKHSTHTPVMIMMLFSVKWLENCSVFFFHS